MVNLPNREDIAKIIDPIAWKEHPHYDKGNRPLYREESLKKADDILDTIVELNNAL